jgi:hypothetical protein
LMEHVLVLGNAAEFTISTVVDCKSSERSVISEHRDRSLRNYLPCICSWVLNFNDANRDSIDDPSTYCKACTASWAMEKLAFGPEPCHDRSFDEWWDRIGDLPSSDPKREVLAQIAQQCTNNGSRFRHEEYNLLGDMLWVHYPTRVVFSNGQSMRVNFRVQLESLSIAQLGQFECDSDSNVNMGLCTAIFHTGSATSGHYTCLVRKQVNNWNVVSDDTVGKTMTNVDSLLYLQRQSVQISIVGVVFANSDRDIHEPEPPPKPRGQPPKGKQWDDVNGRWVLATRDAKLTTPTAPKPRGQPPSGKQWDTVNDK